MICQCCCKKYKQRNEDGARIVWDARLLKPQGEWTFEDIPEFEWWDICPKCSTYLNYKLRDLAIEYAESDKVRENYHRNEGGITNEERNMLIGADDAIDGRR